MECIKKKKVHYSCMVSKMKLVIFKKMIIIISFLYHPPQPTEKMSLCDWKILQSTSAESNQILEGRFLFTCYEKRIINEPHDALGLFQNFSVYLVVSEKLKKFFLHQKSLKSHVLWEFSHCG